MTDITQLHQALKQYVDWGFWSVLFWTNNVAKLSTSHVVSLLSNIMKNVISKILLLSFPILGEKKKVHVTGALRNFYLWWQGQTNSHLKIMIFNKTNKKNGHLWISMRWRKLGRQTFVRWFKFEINSWGYLASRRILLRKLLHKVRYLGYSENKQWCAPITDDWFFC